MMQQAIFDSPLVTRRPGERPGVFSIDPILSERQFTRWLTMANREIPEGDQNDVADRISDYDGALLAEFFATLSDRIAYWTEIRDREVGKNKSRFSESGETVGTGEIGAYIERLEWVARRANDPEFWALDGGRRFWIVAIALTYGTDSALRYWHGASDWSDDTLQEAHEACCELELLIYEERGLAVKFAPAK